MTPCKLVLVEGIPGPGKTTTATFESKRLLDRHDVPSRLFVKAIWTTLQTSKASRTLMARTSRRFLQTPLSASAGATRCMRKAPTIFCPTASSK